MSMDFTKRKERYEEVAKELNLELIWDDEIIPGDLYLAERNQGVKLLEAKEIKDGYIVPTTLAYCYDIFECCKVKEK